MISSTAGNTPNTAPRSGTPPGVLGLVNRKLWIPKILYDALPWFYCFAGIASFLATLYIGDWFWILPHYLLFSVACCHLGVVIFRRRLRGRAEELASD